jgi:hypothetical protein
MGISGFPLFVATSFEKQLSTVFVLPFLSAQQYVSLIWHWNFLKRENFLLLEVQKKKN